MAKDDSAAPPAPHVWAKIPSRERFRRRYFPEVTLITHEGEKVRLYEDLFENKCVIFNFMYAHCQGICSPITSNLKRVQSLLGNRVGRDIFMYSFTLKPDEDSPAELKAYAKARKLGPGWTFLTGAPDDLERVRKSFGFYDSNPVLDADKTNHTGMVRYGNEGRQLWSAFPGMSKAEAIAKSILWVAWPPGKAPRG